VTSVFEPILCDLYVIYMQFSTKHKFTSHHWGNTSAVTSVFVPILCHMNVNYLFFSKYNGDFLIIISSQFSRKHKSHIFPHIHLLPALTNLPDQTGPPSSLAGKIVKYRINSDGALLIIQRMLFVHSLLLHALYQSKQAAATHPSTSISVSDSQYLKACKMAGYLVRLIRSNT
jgi:hypothetical protein